MKEEIREVPDDIIQVRTRSFYYELSYEVIEKGKTNVYFINRMTKIFIYLLQFYIQTF